MDVCMDVRMYGCTYVWMYSMYVCMYVCMYVRTYCTYIRIRICTYTPCSVPGAPIISITRGHVVSLKQKMSFIPFSDSFI